MQNEVHPPRCQDRTRLDLLQQIVKKRGPRMRIVDPGNACHSQSKLYSDLHVKIKSVIKSVGQWADVIISRDTNSAVTKTKPTYPCIFLFQKS